MTSVESTVRDAAKMPVPFAQVRITLITGTANLPGYTADGELVTPHTVTADENGAWSIDLTPTSQIQPSGTYYQVWESGAASTAQVPDSGGPYQLSQILVTPPPTPAAPGITGLRVARAGTTVATRPTLNLIPGSNTTVTAVDDPTTGSVDVTISSTGGSGGVQLGADLAGTLSAPQVVSTHLGEPLPADQGGTGEGTLQAALNALAAGASAGHVLRGDGTDVTLSAIEPSDLPTATTSAQGAVELGSQATDLQPQGVADPGDTGRATDHGHTHPVQPWQFLITAHGAVGDLQCVTDGVMTNGSAVVTSASGKFTAQIVGMPAVVKGALASGQTSLVATWASYQSPTQATLSLPATASGTGLQVVWGTDDTAAIQGATDAAMAYKSPFGIPTEVVTPPAPGALGYMLAGPLKQSDGVTAAYNSQITTGVNAPRNIGKTLVVKGMCDAGSTRFWDSDSPFFNGATWFSTAVFANATDQTNSINAHGNPSVLGGPTGANGYGVSGVDPLYNNITVHLTDMSIMTPFSASGWTVMPFNFHGCARAHIDRCSFGTSGVVQLYKTGGLGDFANTAGFSAGLCFGGLMPSAGNNASNRIRDSVWHGGHTYGPLFTEHTVGDGNVILYNWAGLAVAGLYGDGGIGTGALHAIHAGQVTVEGCDYHLIVIGAGQAGVGPTVHAILDTEGQVQIRDNAAGAALAAANGTIVLAGSSNVPGITFPTGIAFVRSQVALGVDPSPPAIAANSAVCNVAHRHATIYLSGGTGVTTIQVSGLANGGTLPTLSTLMDFTSSGTVPNGTSVRVGPGQWVKVNCTTPPAAVWQYE